MQGIHGDAREVRLALREPIANEKVIVDPHRLAGVSVFKPAARCERGIKHRLARLTASK